MRILVAGDDSILVEGLLRALRRSGYAVDHAADGKCADGALAAQLYDLLILDLSLSLLSGNDVLKRLRGRGSALPVLVLNSADSVDARVRSLDLGADDYMAIPFAQVELEARVRALTRRGCGGGPTTIRIGALSFDQTGRIARINDAAVDLSSREVGLLEVLLLRIGRLVSKQQLVDHLCEWGEEISDNAIEVYVHRLRRKVESGGVRIVTMRGLGYCLEKPAAQTSAGMATTTAATTASQAISAATALPRKSRAPADALG